MHHFIRKLFFGNNEHRHPPGHKYVDRRKQNIKAIWNNEHHEDFGLEKIIRLFLAGIQFFFPLSHLKQIADKIGPHYKDLLVDFCVLLKLLFPLLVILNNWQYNPIIFWLMIWIAAETVFYIPALIFASDSHMQPRSYRRAMLLLFLNYMELILVFGALYSHGTHFNHPFTHWFDGIYLSISHATALGLGDFVPQTLYAKILISIQQILFLWFVVISINFFASNIERKGYFKEGRRVDNG
ncbi:MAG: two pore domain potassium channel family protein [Saprospiraceae bacterium]|nr:two pore domain potassium channel family protein [Saprospiraceae bacterium]